jgi:lysine-N-methylase
MDNLIIKANYVNLFSCVGPACEDSCCNDWNIHFDKKSYKNTVRNPEFAALAKIAFKEVKTSVDDWAVIKLDSHGGCPFLNEQKLCQIHAKLGESALSHTCKTYPKVSNLIGGNKYESLGISCPEVAKIVLFDPNAFQFEALSSGHKTPAKPSPVWLEKSYEYSLDLLVSAQLDWEQALFAIGLLIKTSDNVLHHQAPIIELDNRLSQLTQFAASGLLTEQFKQISYTAKPQEILFFQIHSELCQAHSRSGRPRFTELNDAVISACNEDNDYSIALLNQAWNEYALPSLIDYPDLFDRYILYYLFHNHFPYLSTPDPSKAFRLLTLDCFMIRCYLSALALKNKGLSQKDIILGFQVYQVVRQHNSDFIEKIDNLMKECGLSSVPAAISLLKTKAS